jgi:hypothetical protein
VEDPFRAGGTRLKTRQFDVHPIILHLEPVVQTPQGAVKGVQMK